MLSYQSENTHGDRRFRLKPLKIIPDTDTLCLLADHNIMFFHITIPNTLRDHYDYLPPVDELICPQTNTDYIGKRITVPFRKSEKIGIITGISHHSHVAEHKLKSATTIIDETPLLSADTLIFLKWASSYYQCPLSELLAIALPAKLRQGAAYPSETQLASTLVKKKLEEVLQPHSLNAEQQIAVTAIIQALNTFTPFLLHGITGSGKTEVYLQSIQRALQENKQILVLVPEIGLTPQLLQRFQQRFNIPIFTYHSGLSDKERYHTWLAANNTQASIIIGTRSAIFLPLPQLGLIVIDEEHDPSFKQHDYPYYSARDLAIVRAQRIKCPIVLGSATPSLESLYNAQQGKYQLLQLTERAGNAKPPEIFIVDLKTQDLNKQKKKQGLTPHLLSKIKEHLDNGNQVLLFINRRGYAPVMFCAQCRWTAKCKHCDAHLTVHQSDPNHETIQDKFLKCHHCETKYLLLNACPDCAHPELIPVGRGTERFEEHLQEHFADHKILRIDRDSTRKKNSFARLVKEVEDGKADILLGTQMLAKGHHFPNVTLVGILDADHGFFNADFRATERLGQLLIQVAGRAGREAQAGEVIIQTHVPEHPLLRQLLAEGYIPFANSLLAERQVTQLAPYHHLALFKIEAKQKNISLSLLQEIKKIALSFKIENTQILGPIPAPMEKRAGFYRAHLLLKSPHRPTLHQLLSQLSQRLTKLKLASKARLMLEIDPGNLG